MAIKFMYIVLTLACLTHPSALLLHMPGHHKFRAGMAIRPSRHSKALDICSGPYVQAQYQSPGAATGLLPTSKGCSSLRTTCQARYQARACLPPCIQLTYTCILCKAAAFWGHLSAMICLMLRVHVAFINTTRKDAHTASHSEVAVWTVNTLTDKSSRQHLSLPRILPEPWTADYVALLNE